MYNANVELQIHPAILVKLLYSSTLFLRVETFLLLSSDVTLFQWR